MTQLTDFLRNYAQDSRDALGLTAAATAVLGRGLQYGPGNAIETIDTFETIATLQGLSYTDGAKVHVVDGARSGVFVFRATSMTAQVASDPRQAIYVPPASAPTGAAGCWVRDGIGDSVQFDWFNPEADVGPALSAALDMVLANNWVLLLPARDLPIGALVYKQLTTQRFSVLGYGSQHSRFVLTTGNTTGCMSFDATWNPGINYRQHQGTFRGFSIVPTASLQGVGLRYISNPGGAQHICNFELEDVYIGTINPDDASTLDIYLDFSGTKRAEVKELTVSTPFGPSIDDNLYTSPRYAPTAGVVCHDAYGWRISKSNIWGCKIGILDHGTDGEGAIVTECRLVGQLVGVDYERVGQQPGFACFDSHINAKEAGLKLKDGGVFKVRGCHFYNGAGDTVSTSYIRDIWCIRMADGFIADNIHHTRGTDPIYNDRLSKRVMVYLDDNGNSTDKCRRIEVRDLHIDGDCWAGVVNAANNTNIEIGGISSKEARLTHEVRDYSGLVMITPSLAEYANEHEVQVSDRINKLIESYYRNPSFGAGVAADPITHFEFSSNDTASTRQLYCYQRAYIASPTAGAHAGGFRWHTYVGGVDARQLMMEAGVCIGTPTGGAKGTGTINVQGLLYANNVPGASGSFVAGAKTVTVTNGLVTGIV